MKTITTEAAQELAQQIKELHEAAENVQHQAVTGLSDLVRARVMVATLAETASANLGTGYHKWWRDNGLPEQWDHKYIRIAKTSKRLNLSDKNQMKLLGIITDDQEADGEHDGKRGIRREGNPFAWIKFAGKVRANLTAEQIKAMDSHERQTARLHLKPLVDLYNDLAP